MRVPAFTLEEYQCSGEHQDDCSNLRTIERAVQQLAAAFGVAPQLGDVDSHSSSHQAHSRQVAGLRDRRLPDKQKDGEGKKSKRSVGLDRMKRNAERCPAPHRRHGMVVGNGPANAGLGSIT